MEGQLSRHESREPEPQQRLLWLLGAWRGSSVGCFWCVTQSSRRSSNTRPREKKIAAAGTGKTGQLTDLLLVRHLGGIFDQGIAYKSKGYLKRLWCTGPGSQKWEKLELLDVREDAVQSWCARGWYF